MKRVTSSFLALCLSLSMGVPAVSGVANAAPPAPINLEALQSGTSNLAETVQYYDYRRDRRHYHRRHWRHHRPRYYRERRYYRPYYRPYYRYARPAPIYRGRGNAHVRWCYNRYRSYRAYDNTFQPNYGPRRRCYSPYI